MNSDMEQNQIFDKVVRIIHDVLENEEVVTREATLVDDLMFDSVSLLYLQVAVEDEFDIRFDPLTDDFTSIFYSVDSLCKNIGNR